MFGALGNLGELMKQAKSLHENMQKVQERLAEQRFEAESGAGMVRAEVNGKGELVRIKVDPKAVEDIELLEDLIVASVAAALKKASESRDSEMAQLTGGLNIPGLTDVLGKGT